MSIPPPAESEPFIDAPPTSVPPPPSTALAATGYAIAGATSQQELIAGLARSMTSCPVDAYFLARFCEGSGDMEIVAAWDASGKPAAPPGARITRAAHPGVELLKPDVAFVCNDCTFDTRLGEENRRELTADGVRSFGLYPLIRRGEIFGVLSIRHRTPHAHTRTYLDYFSVIAQLTSVVMASIDSRAELAHQLARSNAIYRVTKALGAALNEDEVLRTATELLVNEMGFVGGWIGIIDEAAQVLRERAMSGAGDYPGRTPMAHPLTDRHVGAVEAVHTGQPVLLLDALKRAEEQGWGASARAASLRTVVCVPLITGDKTLGAMGVGRREVTIPEDEITILSMFGSQLATALLRLRADAERQKQVKALEEAYASQARLLETVHELSTPVIPVHHGILVVPLVGTIDSLRSAQVMEALLNAIQKDRASVVILDVTGVPTVDTGVANHLLRSTRAAELLGAKCILVGISPVVARTIVQLGVDMGDVITRNNLQAGISYALSLMNLEIRQRDEAW